MSCLFSQIVSFEFKIFTENWIVEYLGVALRLRVSANTAACASHRSLSLGRFRSCIPPGGGRGGGTHLYKPYRYVPLQGYGIWAFLVWKRVYTLPILVWNRVWFSNYGSIIMKYLSFQFQMNKTDAFEEFFCLRSNLSNTLFSRMVICSSNLVFE